MLGALILALSHDSGGKVGDPHGARGFIDVLSSGPAGSIGVDPEVGLLDFDFRGILHFSDDIDGGERGVAALIGIKRGDPDETVNSTFSLEIPIGVSAFNNKRGVLNSCLFPRLKVDHPVRVTVPVHPTQIHPKKHLSPVARFGTPRAGIDTHDGVAAVEGIGKEALKFESPDFVLQPVKVLLDFPEGLGIALLENAEKLGELFGLLLALLKGFDDSLERLEPFDGLLGGFTPVPEAGCGHFLIQADDFLGLGIEVKDTP